MMHFTRIAALAAMFIAIPSFLYAEQHYAVQAGSLSDKARAQKFMSRLFASGYDCRTEAQGDQYKVICGKFKSLADVKSFRQKLRSKGYADAFSVRVTTGGQAQMVSEEVEPGNGNATFPNKNRNANITANKDITEYYSVQVGSLSDKDRARKLLSRLSGRSLDCKQAPVGFKFSVICGQLETVADARALRQKLRSMGYSDAFAVHVLNGGVIKDISAGVDPEDKLTGALAEVDAMHDEALEYYSVQLGSPGDRARAEKLVGRISVSDIKCVPLGVDGMFKVLCGSYNSHDGARGLKQKLISKGYADAFTVRVKGIGGPRDDIVNINTNLNLLRGKVTSVKSPLEPLAKPASIGSGVWGRGGGHFHPFVAVSSIFTDNLYSTNDNRAAPEEDNVTVSTLGFWLSFPAMKQPIRKISTVGYIPGGYRGADILPYREGKRLAFISYRAENKRFAEHGYEDGTSHYASGYIGYETPGGHTIALDDRYESSRAFIGNAIAGTGFVNSSGDYDTNRLAINGRLSASERASLDIYHISFGLSYDDDTKALWNREDTVNILKLNYNVSPKTHISLGYSVKDVDYLMPVGTDRIESSYLLGLSWSVTGKTAGRLEVGKSFTEFDGTVTDSDDEMMVYTGRLEYKSSSKTSLKLTFSKSRAESDNIGSQYFIHDSLGLSTKFYPFSKLRAEMGVKRALNTYFSVVSGGEDKANREDERTFGYIMFSYVLNRNVAFELGATYTSRVSNMDIYDFEANGLYTGIAASF